MDEIRYKNRYTGQVETEKVLGGAALRWVYGTTLGRLSLHVLIKRGIFSRLLGWMKNRPGSAKDIAPFVEEYGIEMDESQKQLGEFCHFNDFFYRQLKQGARPLCGAGEIASPADARHSAWANAAEIEAVFVKGQRFDLAALLGDADLAARYAQGSILLSRLCPVDYHRFHFPVSGVPEAARRIAGPLASVSPYCLRQRLSWLWTNKRELTVLHSEELGDVLLLAVGATGVGSVFQTYTPQTAVEKGAEQGYFAFGGSTVMCFFLPGLMEFSEDVLANTAAGMETFVRQGDAVGRVR